MDSGTIQISRGMYEEHTQRWMISSINGWDETMNSKSEIFERSVMLQDGL